jgi:hypothetical protein
MNEEEQSQIGSALVHLTITVGSERVGSCPALSCDYGVTKTKAEVYPLPFIFQLV